jgi:hypothetical protein
MNEQNKKACVYFHQGWTDIIMCFALINYYKSKYDEIYVLIRSDAKALVDFYVRKLYGVNIVYLETDNGRFYGNIITNSIIDYVRYHNNIVEVPENFDVMFHAEHDIYRKDQYRGYWHQPEANKKITKHFSEMFYTFYDISFTTRITDFSIERDLELENITYLKFVETYGDNYVIYHDDEDNHSHGSHHVSTKIDFKNKIDGCAYVNLNKQSKIFFDHIKILQNAREIHLIDSIWGCLFYQLDAKYGILKNKEINLYCKRGHENLFLYPVTLDNWKMIK